MHVKTLIALAGTLGVLGAGPTYAEPEPPTAPAGPELTISGAVEPAEVKAGTVAEFTWTASNETSVNHTSPMLQSVLKSGWTLADGSDPRCEAGDANSPHYVQCDLDELTTGDETTVLIRAGIPANATAETVEISATASSEHTPADGAAPYATVELTVTGDRAPCACTKEYNPVIGSDGKTYANPCMAECAGVEDYKPKPISTPEPDPEPTPCVCPHVVDPVLGSDGKVYNNACEANCAGVDVVKKLPSGGDDTDPLPPCWSKPTVCPTGFPPPPPPFIPGGGWTYQLSMASWPTSGEQSRPIDPITDLCPDDLPPGAVC